MKTHSTHRRRRETVSSEPSKRIARRRFLKQSAAAVGVLGLPAVVHSASPNALLQVACVGVGGMGGATMRSVGRHASVKIVSLCDVDAKPLDAAAKDYPGAARHKDWRELLGAHAAKFDAVTVGTPDHVHAAIAVTALRAKKHVPIEKYPRDFKGRDHYFDWVDAMLQGRKSCADFSHGGPLTEAVLVGAMADRFATQWLHWDRPRQVFTDNPQATALVRRAYRDGWKVPGLG